MRLKDLLEKAQSSKAWIQTDIFFFGNTVSEHNNNALTFPEQAVL